MSCVYRFKENPENGYSYQALVEYFKDNVTNYHNDIVYSKKSKQELVVDDLFRLKLDSKLDSTLDSFGDTDFTDGKHYTTLTFIDSNNYVVNGNRPIYKLSDEDHLENLSLSFENEDNIPREQALLLAQNQIQNGKIIGEDAKEFHTLINSYNWFNADIYSFIEHCKGTKFENLATKIFQQMDSGSKSLRKIMYGRHNLNNLSAKIITGVNLKAELFPLEEEIFGHYDNIVIDNSGNLHVYNYKITSTPISEWGKVKMEKYKHLFALLKRILEANGFTGNITLHIVPIRLKYDDNFLNILDVVFHNTDNIELTVENNKYVFGKYDDIAKYFIKTKLNFQKVSTQQQVNVDTQLSLFFPDRNIRHDGIVKTAEEWIRLNYNSKIQLRIKSAQPSGYDLYFDDNMEEPIHVESGTHPYKNQELIEKVEEHIEELLDNSHIVIQRILKTIENSRTRGYSTFGSQSGKAFGQSGQHLGVVLNKYFKFQEINNKKIYDWDLIEDDLLSSAGILLFLNRKTHLVDIVTLTNYNLNTLTHFKGRNNIMGSYVPDNNKAGKLIEYPSTFGNIEAIRTMLILNEIIPNIKSSDFRLGQMIVLSSANRGLTKFYNIGEFNDNCFKECLKIFNHNNPNSQIKSNFGKVKYLDPLTLAKQSLLNIVNTENNIFSNSEKENFKNLGFENIESIESRSVKAQMILELMDNLVQIKGCEFLKNSTIREIVDRAKEPNNLMSQVARFYIDLSKALLYYKGISVQDEKYLSKFDRNGFVQRRVPNKTYRNITTLFTSTINDVALQVLTLFSPVNTYLLDYYKSINYSTALNKILGNLASQFTNLYKRNIKGEMMMEFRNPYLDHDEFGVLSSAEKKVLKNALFTLAKYRSLIYGITFNYSSPDDPKLQTFIKEHAWYFNVPLLKASSSSTLQKGIGSQVKEWKHKAELLIKKGDLIYNEFISSNTKEEQELYAADFETLNLTNPFIRGDGIRDINARENYLLNHDTDYFEYDLSNILGHYITEYIKCKELNKTLLTAKATMLSLELLGEGVGDSRGVKLTIDMIQDHIKLNVFNQSLMEPQEQEIVKWLTPFRDLVSKAYIAGNIVSMFRDTFEGLWQNMMRTVNKYLTDLKAESVAAAYKEVVLGALSNIVSVHKVDLLCRLYRLSNMDVYKIADSVSSSRTGIFNVENWMYATLRAPDFLNRMVLFTARCIQDGVWDAYSVENGELIYNPKKDKRFQAYFESDPNSEEYRKAKIAYYNAIRMYNLENPENLIGYSDTLPQAYSKLQIEQMRQLSDSIYGAYDKSMRARYEHLALGWAFGTFSTWFNGIVGNYMAKPGIYYDGDTTLELETDESGNKIWLRDNGTEVIETLDENGNSIFIDALTNEQVTKDESWVPALKHVPRVVQGIYYTLKQIIPELRNGMFKENIWHDATNRHNLMKLFSDVFMWALFYCLFKFALTPAYKEFKKNMKNYNILASAGVELLYKSGSRSYDGFGGMLNVILYLGENVNPPTYSLPIKLTVDSMKTMFGDKTVLQLLYSDVAVLKAFLDTFKANYKK